MVLPIALGLLTVLSIMVVTLVNYSSSNQRHASYSKTRITAFNLAESGINNAVAVLNQPTNDALNPNLFRCGRPSIPSRRAGSSGPARSTRRRTSGR